MGVHVCAAKRDALPVEDTKDTAEDNYQVAHQLLDSRYEPVHLARLIC